MIPAASLILTLSVTQVPPERGDGVLTEEDLAPSPGEDGSLERSKVIKAAMRKRMAEDRVRLRFLQKEEGSLLHALDDFDRQLREEHRKGSALALARQRLEVQLQEVGQRLEDNGKKLAAAREQIGRRASAMFRLRRTPLAELLVRSGSPIEHRRLAERLRLVLEYDARLIRELREATEEAERLRARLDEEQAALEQTGKEIDARTEATLALREERDALLAAIRREEKLVKRLAGEIQRAAKKLESELGIIRGLPPHPTPKPGDISAQRRALRWPTVGRVELPFGKQVDPETGVVLVHRGIDLRAPWGQPVVAVFDGVVRHVGELDGFGLLAVVEHAPRWYSLYAHLGGLEVRAGDRVQTGEVLGTVGDSGSRKGPFLYFELREGRKAVDPQEWLAR